MSMMGCTVAPNVSSSYFRQEYIITLHKVQHIKAHGIIIHNNTILVLGIATRRDEFVFW